MNIMDIRQIQDALDLLGYGPIDNDGVFGPATRKATKKFQQQEGLSDDGIPGPLTKDKLLEAVTDGRVYKPQKTTSKPPGKTGTFWDAIKYFTRDEPYIACSCGRCGGFPVEPTEEIMRLADRVREQAGTIMIPSSTVRCKQHNAEVGGVRNSRHLLGKAMDFRIQGWSSAETLALVKEQSGVHYAYAIDNTYVHMDVE